MHTFSEIGLDFFVVARKYYERELVLLLFVGLLDDMMLYRLIPSLLLSLCLIVLSSWLKNG